MRPVRVYRVRVYRVRVYRVRVYRAMVRALAATLGAAMQLLGALAVTFSMARAVSYPVWAVTAAQAELARSWGGPSRLGATLVHWLVAAALAFARILLFRIGGRWRTRGRRRDYAAAASESLHRAG